MLHSVAKQRLAELFRFYWNDFLTVSYFAEYHGLTETRANRLINAGRRAHNLNAERESNHGKEETATSV